MKYFVVSLHRTGTRSTVEFLKTSLNISAIHHATRDGDIDLRNLIEGHEDDIRYVGDTIRPTLDKYDCAADVPIPAIYDYLHEHYPDARFLLLFRGTTGWIKSVREKGAARPFSAFERVQYWRYFPWKPNSIADLHDQQLVFMQAKHTSDVISHFGQKPNSLGVFDLENPDCNLEISRFVGLNQPQNLEFPRIGAKKKKSPIRRAFNFLKGAKNA